MHKIFNLDEAKAGAKVITRDGNRMHFVAHCPEAKPSQRLLMRTEDGTIWSYFESGFHQQKGLRNVDLFMYEPKWVQKEVWLNVYSDGINTAQPVHTTMWATEQEADSAYARGNRDTLIGNTKRLGDRAQRVIWSVIE